MNKTVHKRVAVRALVGALAAALCGSVSAQAVGAEAELRNVAGDTVGTATFKVVAGGVEVTVEVEGFTGGDGAHGVHIHETGTCSPDFGAAGAHFNPDGLEHGLQNP